jgi:hypothetical protein
VPLRHWGTIMLSKTVLKDHKIKMLGSFFSVLAFEMVCGYRIAEVERSDYARVQSSVRHGSYASVRRTVRSDVQRLKAAILALTTLPRIAGASLESQVLNLSETRIFSLR